MNTIILPYGSKVQLTNVDMSGYWGREFHPKLTDVGFLGVIVDVVVSDEDGEVNFTFKDDDESFNVCYKVRAADGRELQLMEHEIEVL